MSTGSMPELLHEVAGRLVSVEEGLAALDNHKRALREHALSVKSDISQAVEHNMTVLRAREKQLIRQVEVMTTHQNGEASVVQSQLLQHKGALAVTRSILDCCADGTIDASGFCNNPACRSREVRDFIPARKSEDSEDICNYVPFTFRDAITTTVNIMPEDEVLGLLEQTEKLLREPLVSVSVNEPALTSTIRRWGHVSLPPSQSLSLPSPHSDLLPHCPEEYGDVEHHVLHKSVQPEVAIGAPLAPIDVRRPYLLAARSRQWILQAAGAMPPLPAMRADGGKEDLVKWLHRMQLDSDSGSCCAGPTKLTKIDGCGDKADSCSLLCVEDACQANEQCENFSKCLLAGQCKRSALQKLEQSAKWQQQQQQQQQQQRDVSEALSSLQSSMCSSPVPEPTRGFSNPILDHMDSILNSMNTKWLLQDGGGDDLCNIINKINIDNTLEYYSTQSNGSVVSPFKVDPFLNRKRNHQSDVGSNKRSCASEAILYNPPTTEWMYVPEEDVLTKDSSEIITSSESTTVLDESVDRLNSENDMWLMPLKEPFHGHDKKANCDKENSLYRAGMIATQMSKESILSSVENLKDKVEKITGDRHEPMTDVEQKESWLLQECSKYCSDNKTLEEELRGKSCLSGSSLSSFSIITDPELRSNIWLLSY